MAKRKSGFIALVGRPNVGKSTLMNHLIGQKIAITANKPQTTRNRIRTVFTDERGQAVFLDTPGIHKAKNRLGEYMVEAAVRTIKEADVVLWLVEPSPFIGKGDTAILQRLKNTKKPTILIINKVDTADKQTVADTIEAYADAMDYDSVFTVSALRGTRVSIVLDRIFELLPYGPMYYSEDTVTDQPMRQIVAEIVREKALRLLQEEIPHGIAVTVEKMKRRKEPMWDIEATVTCEKDSHKGIIIGKGGSMLKRIGADARRDIENMMEEQVNLRLFVKVRENWRDSDILLKNYGYHEDGL